MSTGTVQNPAVQVIINEKYDALQYQFGNGEADELVAGEEVYLAADGDVNRRSAAADFPFGNVVVGAASGERVTVRTRFTMELKVANNSGADVSPGDLLRSDGTKNSDGYPNYTASEAASLSGTMAITGGADGELITVGVLDFVHTV